MSRTISLAALRQTLRVRTLEPQAARRVQGGCNDPIRCEPFIVDTDRPNG
jgi:hypothetical protein